MGLMSIHTLTAVEYQNDGDSPEAIYATITCTAPVGAWCRMYCPEGCDEWSDDHDTEYDHKLVDYGECLSVEYFDATDVLECGGAYLGKDVDLSLGPVRVEWSDGWSWYRDETAP